ncbi:hypothetical protein ACFL3T_05025 [Patescibacteria group bacterium]
MKFTYENFSHKAFVDYIMKEMKLTDADPDVTEKIKKEILRTLGDRILLSIMSAMNEENLLEFEMMQATYPGLSEFEMLFSIIDKVPALHEVFLKNVNDLAEELLHDVSRLDEVIDKHTKVETK